MLGRSAPSALLKHFLAKIAKLLSTSSVESLPLSWPYARHPDEPGVFDIQPGRHHWCS